MVALWGGLALVFVALGGVFVRSQRKAKERAALGPIRAEARSWGVPYDEETTYWELRARINEFRRQIPEGDPVATAARALRMQSERRR